MITTQNVTKYFGKVKALDNVSLSVKASSVFGLIGSNGAGKSTVLRILAGVFQKDGGSVSFDGQEPFENVDVKCKTLFVPDYPYFFPQSTVKSMSKFYKKVYSSWNDEKYNEYLELFKLDSKKQISSMSKGMQRQAAIILGLSCSPKFILFDEVFDGIDPMARVVLRKIIIDFVAEQQAQVVISSHNLRELDDFVDHVALLHNGKILMESDLDELHLQFFKIHFALENQSEIDEVKSKMNVLSLSQNGSAIQMVVQESKDKIESVFSKYKTILMETTQLDLESIFVAVMEENGYEIGKEN